MSDDLLMQMAYFFGTGSGYGKVKKTGQFLTPKTTKGMRYRIFNAG